MTLSINTPDYNAAGLDQNEVQMMAQFDAMTADEQAEVFHAANQAHADQRYIDSQAQNDINNDIVVQRLAGGGAVVGGELRPDALVTLSGIEMTVQQAIDAGLYSSEALGQHTGDMEAAPESEQAGLLGGVDPSEITVNKYGQVLHQDDDGSVFVYDEADDYWYEAELDQ